MSDDPCKKLEDEYKTALEEYLDADMAASAYVNVGSLDNAKKYLDGDEMTEVYNRRDVAY